MGVTESPAGHRLRRAPRNGPERDASGREESCAHQRLLLLGLDIVPITKGRLDLGTWQRVFYAEFDGQRDKRLIVKAMGE